MSVATESTLMLSSEARMEVRSGVTFECATGANKGDMTLTIYSGNGPLILDLTAHEAHVLSILIDRTQRDCR